MNRRTCETCGAVLLKQRTREQLLLILAELHGELTMRAVPPGLNLAHVDSYRNARATERIRMVLAEENRRFCPRHATAQALRAPAQSTASEAEES